MKGLRGFVLNLVRIVLGNSWSRTGLFMAMLGASVLMGWIDQLENLFASKVEQPPTLAACVLVLSGVGLLIWGGRINTFMEETPTPWDERRYSGECDADELADYIVILVHGTFARGTKWAAEGSVLRTALSKAYGDAIRFEIFEWSGHNSHRERVEAGRELGRFMDILARQAPRAKLVIICHSHGGNVALYAGRSSHDIDRLAGIACLATPFIYAAPRSSRSIRVMDKIIRYTGPTIGQQIDKVRREAKQLITDLTWAPLRQTDILSLSYRNDEARWFLGHLTAMAEWPTKLLNIVAPHSWRVFLYSGAGAASACLLALGLNAAGSRQEMADLASELAAALVVIPVIIAGIALFVHHLARASAWLHSHPGGLGWGNPAHHAYARIETVDEPTSLLCRSLFHSAIDQGDFDAGSWLGHCEIHDDPRIHHILIHWLETIATRSDNPTLIPKLTTPEGLTVKVTPPKELAGASVVLTKRCREADQGTAEALVPAVGGNR